MKKKNCIFAVFWILFLLFPLGVPLEAEAAFSRETAVVKAVRKVSPAVVNIGTEYPVGGRGGPFARRDPFFEWFFRDFFEERRYERSSLGSGVVIDGEKGYILTNAHVIEQAGKITVAFNDEREFEAGVIGADRESDLAVLRVSVTRPLPEAKMGRSDDLMIGEDVIAIGNPFGFSHSVTTGVISALNRNIRTDDTVYHDFIQTDASINPGNSGGPLLNINGELIGINTAIYAKAQGIGFAIPIDKARRVVSNLIQYGEVPETWVGLTVQDISERMARYLDLRSGGVMVKKVDSGSPAEKAGVREGDIILELGGLRIRSTVDFNSSMKGYTAGDAVRVSLLREGESLKIRLVVRPFPEDLAETLGYELFGVRVAAARSGRGVIITEIRPRSHLAEIGVRPGDVIHQIDEMVVNGPDDFEKAVVKYRNRGSVVILLVRDGRGYYVTINL